METEEPSVPAIRSHADLLQSETTGAARWLAEAVALIAGNAALFPPIDEDDQPPEFLYPH